MKITLTREANSWRYRTQNGKLVGFEACTIGKYKGKTFMSVYTETENCICEEYLLEVTKEIKYYDTPRKVRILEEVEVNEERHNRMEVFFNCARKTSFSIDGEKSFEGYTFNRYWNGFDCPYFTKEVAMEICKEFSFKYDEVEECRRFYDEETDTFYEEDWNCDYEREEIGNPMEINTEDGKIKVYDFGGSWVWAEVEE